MSNKVEFDYIATIQLDVMYLRGRERRNSGYWVVTSCAHPLATDIHHLSFIFATAIPDDASVARGVMSYNDAAGHGISGKDARVIRAERYPERARFVVETTLYKAVRP